MVVVGLGGFMRVCNAEKLRGPERRITAMAVDWNVEMPPLALMSPPLDKAKIVSSSSSSVGSDGDELCVVFWMFEGLFEAVRWMDDVLWNRSD